MNRFPHQHHPSPKKSLPMLPRANHGPTQAFSGQFGSEVGYWGSEMGYFGSIPGFPGPNPGQFGSEPGYFGSILGRFRAFLGQNRAVLGPVFPSREPPPPREMCKNFTSQPTRTNAPPPPRFPKTTQIIGCLSQIAPNSPLSVYR